MITSFTPLGRSGRVTHASICNDGIVHWRFCFEFFVVEMFLLFLRIVLLLFQIFFPRRFATSGFMIRLSVLEGGTLSVTEKEKKKKKKKDWPWSILVVGCDDNDDSNGYGGGDHRLWRW